MSYYSSRPSRDLLAAAHQQVTQIWWETRLSDFDVFISQLVLDEAGSGDSEAARRRLELLEQFRVLEITEEVENLASALVRSDAIPEKSAGDAAHIALAAVHGVHFLLTWNCAHIANAETIEEIQEICAENTFQCPVICTPEELLGGNYVE